MREKRGAGQVCVRYVPTNENTSDIFTKILSRQLFEKHRRTALNLAGVQSKKLPRCTRMALGAGGAVGHAVTSSGTRSDDTSVGVFLP